MDELVAVIDTKLGEGAVEVSLHRSHRDEQPVGDLMVGQAGRDQHRDLAFTVADGQRPGCGSDSGVPCTTPHDLRHTAASLAVSAGANVKAIQKMLGHASAAMTLDIYADLFDDDLEAVATALDKARSRESVGKMWARPRGPTR